MTAAKTPGLGLDRVSVLMKSVAPQSSGPAPAGRERRSFVGGSDAAGILGLSPWATPLDVYFAKTGTAPPSGSWSNPTRERALKRGKRAEPHAIDMAIEEHGLVVTKRSDDAKNYYIHPEHAFIAAEIDFEWTVTADLAAALDLPEDLIGTTQNGEVKSVHPFAAGKFGEEATDEVPIEYGIQALHGLGVTGRAITLFLVLAGWDDLTLYVVRRDDETIATMFAEEVRFWTEHVLAKNPPEPRNLPDVVKLFKRLGTVRVEATPELEKLVADLKAQRAAKATLEADIDATQFAIGAAVLGEEKIKNPETVDPGEAAAHIIFKDAVDLLKIEFRQQFNVNDAKLKAEFPAVAEACAKVSQFFVYTVPRAKKASAGKVAA